MNSGEKGTYKGGWKANKMHAFGVFKWASGRVYAGNWRDDLKNGVGKLGFKGGNESAGEYLNDKREGYGYYRWSDGRRYKGWWHENKQHGLGMYFSPEAPEPKYGLWQMGKRIKWFSEPERELIRAGHLNYVALFSPEHLPLEDSDHNLQSVDLI